MPRSKNPAAYPAVFFKMVDMFLTNQQPLTHECPDKRTAVDLRNQWYSFIKALSTEMAQARKRGDLQEASTLRLRHDVAVRRMLSISPPVKDPEGPRTLTWFDKNLLAPTLSLEQTVDAWAQDTGPDQPAAQEPEYLSMLDGLTRPRAPHPDDVPPSEDDGKG